MEGNEIKRFFVQGCGFCRQLELPCTTVFKTPIFRYPDIRFVRKEMSSREPSSFSLITSSLFTFIHITPSF